jgi:hypothetical protein
VSGGDAPRRDRRPFAALAVMGALALGLAAGVLMGSTAGGQQKPLPAVTRTVTRSATATVTAPPQGPLPSEPSPVPVVSGNG